MAQAGKSGTTTSNRDALFAGYTPYYTCVVWGGFDDNSKQVGGNGTTYPKNLWRSVMKRIHENLEAKDFAKPSNITSASVCGKSGLLPEVEVCDQDPRGSQVRSEYFAKGTEPSEYCDHHIKIAVCTESGEVVGPYCPEECVEEHVFIVGAENGSGDYKYCATEGFLEKTCSLHDENYVPEEEEPEEPEEPEAPTDGEDGDEENPGETEGSENGSDPGTGDDPAGGDPGTDLPVEPPVADLNRTEMMGLIRRLFKRQG